MSLLRLSLMAPEPCYANRGAQLPGLCLLFTQVYFFFCSIAR
jgi:hypothetical protein